MKKLKEFFNGAKNKLAKLTVAGAVATPLAVTALASGETPAVPGVAITAEMLQPLVDGITANIGVILPIGIGLMAIFIGINLIPKLIKKFTK